MARIDDELLDEHAVVAERAISPRSGRAQSLRQLRLAECAMRMPLPPPPAEALIITGIADLVGDLHGVLSSSMTPRWPGTVRDLGGLAANFFDSILSPIAAMALGFGPMNTMPALASASRKRRALGEKAVAGMHGLGAGRAAGLDDLVDHQIALSRGRRPDQHRLVRHLDMQRVAVGLGIDGDRRDAHLPRGADDPAGDLAAVGDQDTLEHACPGSVGHVV